MAFEIFLIALLGLAMGSFLGVVTWRMPKGKGFIKGRSHCPKCGSTIRWFDNLPLLSYLLLGGRCRSCRRRISWRYPLIEGVTAIGFVFLFSLLKSCSSPQEAVCYWKASYGNIGVILLFAVLLLTIAIFVIDLEKRIIPDELIFTGFVIILLPLVFGPRGDLFLRLWAAFSAASFLLLLHFVTKGKGMGLGDVKYALSPGLFLGWPSVVVWLFVAFLTGAAVAIILILTGKAKRKDKIAFGPFLALSLVITSVWGKALSIWLLP